MHIGAFLDKNLSNRFANAFRAAGNQNRFAAQIQFHVVYSRGLAWRLRMVGMNRPARSQGRRRRSRQATIDWSSAMKFVYFNDTRFGAVDGAGTGVVDLTETAARLSHRDRRDLVAAVIAAYDEIAPALIAATAAGPALPPCRRRAFAATAGTAADRLHGGQLHGGRHPRRAGADQRVPQEAQAPSSVPAAPWRCPTRRPRCLRERPNWRW